MTLTTSETKVIDDNTIRRRIMLVLTRKPDQAIMIADGKIQLKILRVNGNQVSIGFSAPENIMIWSN